MRRLIANLILHGPRAFVRVLMHGLKWRLRKWADSPSVKRNQVCDPERLNHADLEVQQQLQSWLLRDFPQAFVQTVLTELSSNQSKQQLQEFMAWNHRWIALLSERNQRTASDTYDLIDQHFGDALFRLNQFEALSEFRDSIDERGSVVLEFGVHTGGSTRQLSRLFPGKTIHGFDSFEGLPERWSHVGRGEFDRGGELPEVPRNVQLHKGWFQDTCPQF